MNKYAVAILICRLERGVEHECLYTDMEEAHTPQEAYLKVLDNIVMSNTYKDCFYKVVRHAVKKIIII